MKLKKNDLNYSLLKKSEIDELLKIINKTEKINSSKTKTKKTKKEWLWQYKNLPTNKSFCYLAKDKKEIIGYYHVPTFKFNFDNKVYLIGNVQDVGILKEYRNLGVFKSLSKYAVKDLSKKVDLLYTFPNKYSIKNFSLNNNFSFLKYLPIFVKQTFFIDKKIKLENEEKIIHYKIINQDIIKLFKDFCLKHQSFVIRDKSFLNWRYLTSPKGKIHIAGLKIEDKLNAAIFYKYKKILGLNSIIILDFAFDDFENLSYLINNLNQNLNYEKDMKFHFIIMSGIFDNMNLFFNENFFKIPKIITPRKLMLLTKCFNKKITKNFNKNLLWLVTLGDWDIF